MHYIFYQFKAATRYMLVIVYLIYHYNRMYKIIIITDSYIILL